MQRFTVGSLAVLAAAVAFQVLARPLPAEAAGSVSPFKGGYLGPVPGGGGFNWEITIGRNGSVTGRFGPVAIPYVGGTASGDFKGKIAADGALAVSGTWTSKTPFVCWDGCVFDGKPPRWVTTTSSFTTLAQMSEDADGNLVGAASTGEAFVWTRP